MRKGDKRFWNERQPALPEFNVTCPIATVTPKHWPCAHCAASSEGSQPRPPVAGSPQRSWATSTHQPSSQSTYLTTAHVLFSLPSGCFPKDPPPPKKSVSPHCNLHDLSNLTTPNGNTNESPSSLLWNILHCSLSAHIPDHHVFIHLWFMSFPQRKWPRFPPIQNNWQNNCFVGLHPDL